MEVVSKDNKAVLLAHGNNILGEPCGHDDYFGCNVLFLPNGNASACRKYIEILEDDYPEGACIHSSYKNHKYNFCIACIVGKKSGQMFYCLMASYTYEEWSEKVSLTSYLTTLCNLLKAKDEFIVESLIYPNDNSFDISLILSHDVGDQVVSEFLDMMAEKLAQLHIVALKKLNSVNGGPSMNLDSCELELFEGMQITAYKGPFFTVDIPLLVRKLVKRFKNHNKRL